jgi:ribulose-phosphate 3-epimerase
MMALDSANPWLSFTPAPLTAPSLLACDFTRLGEQAQQAIDAGAEVLHVDVMDGHFVPNLSIGPAVVGSLRDRFPSQILDVHLMVTDPAFFAPLFADAGASSVTFHIEAAPKPRAIVEHLHGRGLGCGVTLRPGTPVEAIRPIVEQVDIVLVMTVEPGYGGQKFMADMLPKIRAIRSWLRPQQRLEVDGGINRQTGELCAEAGADVFVAGVDIFRSGDIAKAIAELRAGAMAGYARRR